MTTSVGGTQTQRYADTEEMKEAGRGNVEGRKIKESKIYLGWFLVESLPEMQAYN